MNCFYQPDLSISHLTPEESHHAVRVLRLRVNEALELTDGKGTWCEAVLTSVDANKSGFRITKTTKIPKRSFSVHLVIAPTKNADRMEWMVEKCTEVGIEKISFIRCRASERTSMSLDRLQKVTLSAMKQSRQAWLPALEEMLPMADFLAHPVAGQKFIAHVDASNPSHLLNVAKPGGDYVILIGPEGDFSGEELELAISKGFQKVNLGPTRLRTETAGIYAVMGLAQTNRG